MTTANKNKEILPHLFRQEYSKMTAVLCRHFGLSHIEIAEDIVSDTFLKASENWVISGIPENPTAWLYTVAKNKTKDYFKHQAVVDQQRRKLVIHNEIENQYDFEFSNQNISDSQLAMIFSVCNPSNSVEAQISLALQILCGFSIEEIANAFLTKAETIKKRLLRARRNLRKDHFQIKLVSEAEIQLRLDTVLKTLYLFFNEGYFSKTNNQLIRKEICSEAIRLTFILTENSLTNSSQTNALLALMYFQSSRLEARMNNGEAILFEEQNKELWNKTLIDKGNEYLINAYSDKEISKYHLEAGIAYYHASLTEQNKWSYILMLYNQLILIEYSPVTALNRTFAFSKVYGKEKAIIEAQKLQLTANHYYQSLLGHLYTDIDNQKALSHYKLAISLTRSKTEKETLTKEIKRLNENKDYF